MKGMRDVSVGDDVWTIQVGSGPIVAAAIHDGHAVRPEVEPLFALSEAERLYEEDPYTAAWTEIVDTRIMGRRSRFEFDLNRPRDRAVYIRPEDAWGLRVWRAAPPEDLVRRSLECWDAFYAAMDRFFAELADRVGCFVVLDLHSYNHRRNGPTAPPLPQAENPDVNVGTGTLDRERWARLVDRFMADLAAYDFLDRRLDVRENVKFRGGYFSRWLHERFPGRGCALAIEYKKFFMDEWTGEADPQQLAAIRQSLASTLPGITEELASLAHVV